MAKGFALLLGIALGVLPTAAPLHPAGLLTFSGATSDADAEPRLTRRQFDHRHSANTTHANSSRSTSPHVTTPVYSDVPSATIEFTLAHLDHLLSSGQVILDDPQGGALELILVESKHSGHLQTLTVTSDGLPGVITRGADHFYATLATQRGVYAIEHRNGRSRLIDQRQLDNRMIPGLPDHLRVPVG